MAREIYKVLLVEDEPEYARLVQCALTRCDHSRFETDSAARLAEARERLAGQNFDAVLLDLSLPDSQGIETLKRLRDQAPRTPLVVLTGLGNEDAALEALDCGAHSYLVKSETVPHALGRAICYAVKHGRSEQERDSAIEQLETAKQALELKNRRLAQVYETAHRFVDDVSHEFRTPLTVIKEYCSIIQEGLIGPVNAEQRSYLDIVNDRVQDLNIMVNDMLDSSRLKAGFLAIRRRHCSIAEIVEHARTVLERKANVRNVRLEAELEADLPTVFGDPEKASRVLINLALNAIKCVPEGGHVRVWARTATDLKDVRIGVTDDGPGIRPDDLASIFGRFKQLEGGDCNSTKGFGLGLSIAEELVRLNFGQIGVESELGRGTTFTFTLPVADLTTVAGRHLAQIERSNEGASCLFILLHIDEQADDSLLEEADAFLQNLVRLDDLLYRVDQRRWLLIAAVNPHERWLVMRRIEQEWTMANRNRPHDPLPPLRHTIRELETPRLLDESSLASQLESLLENVHD